MISESGGDNLAGDLSPDLVDFTIYILTLPRVKNHGHWEWLMTYMILFINETDLHLMLVSTQTQVEDTLHFRNEDSSISQI